MQRTHANTIEVYHADGTAETISRVIQDEKGCFWIYYKARRFQVFGGVNGPYFIKATCPLLSR